MPVTFHPSSQLLAPVADYRLSTVAHDPFTLLQGTCRKEVVENVKGIFQSSFGDLNRTSIVPTSNGFVNGAVEAYNRHHHLVIRPDDVWLAILTQFSLFVNANAETLRKQFVSHKGQKPLQIQSGGNRYTANIGSMAEQMGVLIQQNVLDPELRAWIIPDFTTTTPNDRVVSSIVMMATLKAYFSYSFSLLCGLPSVTLLGEKKDWSKMLERIGKLPSFGKENTQWHSLLKPVLSRFVSAFDKPDSKENKDFWQKIAHSNGGGSGPRYLSGWITAFTFFNGDGKSLYDNTDGALLDGVKYHKVDTQDIPPAYAEAPVTLDDNGVEFKTILVAGAVGYGVTGKQMDTVQPASGWWMFEEKGIMAGEKGSKTGKRQRS